MAKSIAIIGSTGRNPAAWVGAFLDAGYRVKNLVRDVSKPPSHAKLEAVPFDLDDRSTYEPGLSHAELLALVTPADPRQTERELALIDAAKSAGVEKIVNLSVIGANMSKPISAFARWQAPVEAALEKSGIPYVTLRPNFFMQNILTQKASIETGQYFEPTDGKACSAIDVKDISDVAVAVSGGAYDGQALDLTGPEALTGRDIGQVLSDVSGRTVTFVSPPIPAFRAAVIDQGIPVWQADALAELYEAVQAGQAGHVERVTNEVEAVTGRAPRTFRQFAQESLNS